MKEGSPLFPLPGPLSCPFLQRSICLTLPVDSSVESVLGTGKAVPRDHCVGNCVHFCVLELRLGYNHGSTAPFLASVHPVSGSGLQGHSILIFPYRHRNQGSDRDMYLFKLTQQISIRPEIRTQASWRVTESGHVSLPP